MSKCINDANTLPFIVISDNNGKIYKSSAILKSDINNDGIVDILDLQKMAMLWGIYSDNADWDGAINLELNPAVNGLQVIDILDLQVLGKCWGIEQ